MLRLEEEQGIFGWTMCTVLGTRSSLVTAPLMVGVTTTVDTMRMLALFVPMVCSPGISRLYGHWNSKIVVINFESDYGL